MVELEGVGPSTTAGDADGDAAHVVASVGPSIYGVACDGHDEMKED